MLGIVGERWRKITNDFTKKITRRYRGENSCCQQSERITDYLKLFNGFQVINIKCCFNAKYFL